MKGCKLSYKLSCFTLSLFLVFGLYQIGIDKDLSDFTIQKYSNILKDEDKIEYKIQYSKETLKYVKNPIIEDRIDNDLTLTNVSSPFPSKYRLDGKIYEGAPLKEDYNDVDYLCWDIKQWDLGEKERLRFNQAYPNSNYFYNSSFRADLLYFPSSQIYKKVLLKDIPLGNVAPILEIVEDRQTLFLGTLDGRLLSINPKSGYIYWEHKLPLGEGINTPFVSFREKSERTQDESYIAVLTEIGKLYLFDCLDGSIIWSKKLLDKPSLENCLMKVLELSDKTLISLICGDELFIIDSKKGEEVLKLKLLSKANTSIFFFLKGSPYLILSSTAGNIKCISINGEVLWSKNLNGEINYEGTLAIFDGVPYLLFATSAKTLYAFNGLTGEVLNTFSLPGVPSSSISFDPDLLSYFLLISHNLEPDKKSFFYGGNLIEPSSLNETKIEVLGKSFIGPLGLRIKDETILYFLNEDGLFYAVQKKAKKPIIGFPVSIVSQNEISSSQPLKGYISSTENTLFITSTNFGYIIVGSPCSISPKPYLCSSNYLASEDLSDDSVNLSGSRFRNDLDSLPFDVNFSLLKPMNVSPHDNFGHILTPTTFFDSSKEEGRIAQTTVSGMLIIMNERGEEVFSLNPKIGPIYTEPLIISDPKKGIKTIYLIGSNGVTALNGLSIKEKWRRDDLGSFGSSFSLIKSASRNKLIFVDKYSYLTSLDSETGETLFREKVDCKDFALCEVDGEKFIFCGSKMIKARDGSVLRASLSDGSSSTAIGLRGKSLLFQSDDLDMLCIDAKSGEIVWRVRKLWCKKYCFDGSSPAILRKGSWALSIWPDYSRIVCIEVNSGLIRWSFNSKEDYFVSKPTIVETPQGAFVFVGSINGKVYAFNCFTGELLPQYPIQLPGKALKEEVKKGASSPVVINGLLLINRAEYGLIGIGSLKETNRLSIPLIFKVEVKETSKNKVIFNQAILYWDDKYKRSNTVKN